LKNDGHPCPAGLRDIREFSFLEEAGVSVSASASFFQSGKISFEAEEEVK
jgi:hypothetical protein